MYTFSVLQKTNKLSLQKKNQLNFTFRQNVAETKNNNFGQNDLIPLVVHKNENTRRE